MKLHLLAAAGFLSLWFSATAAHAGCTLRDKQALLDSGMSLYEIDKTCGETTYTERKQDSGKSRESELTRPKMPDTHGRLQESSNICQTDYLWCEASQSAPPGTPCQCNTKYGPLFGVIVRR